MAHNNKGLASFDAMPDIARVRIDVVAQLLSCSKRTVHKRISDGVIPAPVKQGGILTWCVGDLRQALGSKR